jgi:hypothetical protein
MAADDGTDEAEPITETKFRWVFYTTFGSGKKGFSGERASCTQMLRKREICTQIYATQISGPEKYPVRNSID